MAIVSSFLFTSYGRLSSKLYNIRLPALISSILNIMDTVRNVKICIFNLSVIFIGCVYLYVEEFRAQADAHKQECCKFKSTSDQVYTRHLKG